MNIVLDNTYQYFKIRTEGRTINSRVKKRHHFSEVFLLASKLLLIVDELVMNAVLEGVNINLYVYIRCSSEELDKLNQKLQTK